jgi:CheY-like chemotaxis protein
MSPAAGTRILVVDDEPGVLRAVQINLGRHDFHVDTATNGQEALSKYARVRPDLVLLDLGLPDMDGLTLFAPFANEPTRRLSSCRRAKLNVTKSARSTWAPTII